ncbi:sigma factor-like helix-turn-helix DNA-binding protein [Sphingosinithalassobacter portus]|uniref:sigma factor-like helix-turn-helix DNA-binding protein n=1 Tax=Stakelama portus TaxID=2676234 RepID=UPI001EFE097D|nr:sigma factor-like helix-turn-helix DNA-binding protein [Sphingosinithalassobacter portus]
MIPPLPSQDELARIEDAVRRLPRLEREVFLAVRLDGLTYAEIAARTRLTPRQVERLFAQALTNILRNMASPRRRWWRRLLP